MIRAEPYKPGHPVSRAVGAAALFALAASIGLSSFPLVALVVFVAGPAALALLFAGRPVDRDTFMANGYATSFAAGLTGAIWISVFADDEIAPAAVAVGAIVSFVLLTFFAIAGCFITSRWLEKRAIAAVDEAPARTDD